MSVVKFCGFMACALVALSAAHGEEPSWQNNQPNQSPQLTAEAAQELAEWARARTQAGGSSQLQAEISPQDIELLENWARSQATSPTRIPDASQTLSPYSSPYSDPYGSSGHALPVSMPLVNPAAAMVPSRITPQAYEPIQATPGLSSRATVRPTQANQAAVPAEPAQISSAVEAAPGEIAMADDSLWGDPWGCCENVGGAGLVAGIEGLFLAPISEPTQQVTLTNLLTTGQYTGKADPGFGAGVRVWLGMENCDGWGFRGRYTHFGNCAIRPDAVVPIKAAPAAFNQSYYLNMDIVDLEITQRFRFCSFETNMSIGGRYARVERNASVIAYGTTGDVDLTGLAVGASEMEGSGLTFSIGGLCPISLCKMCGWNLIGNFRGSVLWADSSNYSLSDASAVIKTPVIASAQARNQASASSDGNSETLFVAEAQLGLEYQRPMKCHRAVFFFRAVAEYQHWQTGDITAGSNSFAFLEGTSPDFGGRIDVSSTASDGDLDLIGFSLGTGITY
jgi:hypothetical protein